MRGCGKTELIAYFLDSGGTGPQHVLRFQNGIVVYPGRSSTSCGFFHYGGEVLRGNVQLSGEELHFPAGLEMLLKQHDEIPCNLILVPVFRLLYLRFMQKDIACLIEHDIQIIPHDLPFEIIVIPSDETFQI